MSYFSASSTSAKNTVTKNCSTCFYGSVDAGSSVSPCRSCVDYDKYVTDSIYFWNEKPAATVKQEDDKVNSPKHYMLFPEHKLEVRQVIQRLMEKMEKSEIQFSPLDYADYFQAMAYFMRFMEKNGKEDLQKGVWYMNRILEAWEDNAE